MNIQLALDNSVKTYGCPSGPMVAQVTEDDNGWTFKVTSIRPSHYDGSDIETPCGLIRRIKDSDRFTAIAFDVFDSADDDMSTRSFGDIATAAAWIATANLFGSWSYARGLFAQAEYADFTPGEIA